VTEVLVRRCSVRIVRRSGWSWGPRPRALVDRALAALAYLIAEQLEAEAAASSARSVRIDVPVRVAAHVRLAELVEGGAPFTASTLAAPLRAAVREAIAAGTADDRVEDPALEPGADEPAPADGAPAAFLRSARADPLAVLLDWEARGELRRLLELLPEPTLTALLHRAHALPGEPAPDPEVAAAVRRAIDQRISEGDATVRMRALLVALVELAAQRERPVREAAAAPRTPATSAGPEPEPSADDSPDTDQIEQVLWGDAEPRTLPTATQRARPGGDDVSGAPRLPRRVVGRALPFLLLRPLSRLGYLDALGAVLDAPAFAAALAWKVLDPPERGWRRAHTDDVTAAAFAGLASHVSDNEVTALAPSAERFAPLLAAVVADAVIRGRPPRAEVAVVRTAADRLLVLDPDGCFVIASASDAEELAPMLHVAAPRLAYLDDSDVRGVVRNLGIRVRALRHHPALDVDRVEECAAAFAARRGTVRAATEDLERALELAAWTALATVSWTLWREREPTDPLLMLERFADLEARVDFESRRLSVTLPLGRRSLDLQEHGLLGTIAEAPWLSGRTVELGTG
jgi:hypothetical protein